MRKIILSLTLILSSILFTTKVNASSFNVSIVGNDTFESEITLSLQVNNLVDFNGSCNGLCGLVGTLNYDTNKLELTSINALEDFSLTQGKSIVLYKPTGVSNNTNILSMKFKNKGLGNNESTTITLSNITASDGNKDITTTDISKSIKKVTKNNTNTTNKKETTTTKKDDATNEEIQETKSNNSYLNSISLSDGKIDFSKDVLVYNLVVDYDTNSIEINATTEDSKSIVEGLGKHSLDVGNNKIELKVKAEDGSEKTYTINITREKEEIINNVDDEDSDMIQEKENNNFIIPISIGLLIIVVAIIFIKKKKH